MVLELVAGWSRWTVVGPRLEVGLSHSWVGMVQVAVQVLWHCRRPGQMLGWLLRLEQEVEGNPAEDRVRPRCPESSQF